MKKWSVTRNQPNEKNQIQTIEDYELLWILKGGIAILVYMHLWDKSNLNESHCISFVCSMKWIFNIQSSSLLFVVSLLGYIKQCANEIWLAKTWDVFILPMEKRLWNDDNKVQRTSYNPYKHIKKKLVDLLSKPFTFFCRIIKR